MPPRLAVEPRFFVYAAGAARVLALTGSSSETDKHVLTVAAVTVAECVGAGERVLVKMHWVAYDACERFDEFHARKENDTTYVITPLGHRTGGNCAQVITVGESAMYINTPPARL